MWEAIKKYFWIVYLLFLVLAAYMAAGLTGNLVNMSLEATPQVDLELAASKASTTRALDFFTPILERNIFNSAAVYVDNGEGGDYDSEAEATTLNLALLGTVFWGPETSMAVIEDKNAKSSEVYHVNDTIGDQATIKRIERGKVYLDRQGKEEVLLLEKMDLAAKSSHRGRRGSSRSRGSTGKLLEGIKNVGDGNYQIDANVVEGALEDLGQLMRQARIVPHLRDGKTDGFKIYNIKSNSLFRKIGLKNGDIIHRINGMEVSSPEQGLQVFETLRNERDIAIDITRRGSRESLNYSIR